MFKVLAHGAFAGLLASSAAAQSSARCRITARGFANSKSEKVGVAVGALPDLHLHLLQCGPPVTTSHPPVHKYYLSSCHGDVAAPDWDYYIRAWRNPSINQELTLACVLEQWHSGVVVQLMLSCRKTSCRILAGLGWHVYVSAWSKPSIHKELSTGLCSTTVFWSSGVLV